MPSDRRVSARRLLCAAFSIGLLGLTASSTFAQIGLDGVKGGVAVASNSARTAKVSQTLGLKRCRVLPVAATITAPGIIGAETAGTASLELTPGLFTTFTLQPFALRTPDFKLMVSDDLGTHEVPAPAPTTFHGLSAAGDEIWASVFEGQVSAVIVTAAAPFERLFIQPVPAEVADGQTLLHALYSPGDILETEHTCGVADCASCPPPAEAGGFVTRGPGCRYVRTVVDCDYPLYTQNSFDVGATVRSVESVMLGVNQLYVNAPFNAEPRFTISRMAVRTTQASDPYNSFPLNGGDAGAILTQVASTWNSIPLIERTLAHLFTGRNTVFGGGDPIGLANVGGMCSGAVGLSETNYSSVLAQRITLTAHEIGHNFGMNHDASGATTIMAPAVGNPAQTTFSATSVTTFNNFLTAQPTCAATAMTDVQPDGASTLKNRPIRIDVLANDGRSAVACPSVVTSFTLPSGASTLGGTLAVSTGTGPGGRNEVLYTPPANVEGVNDAFSYLAAGILVPVQVDIQIPRVPDGLAGADPGLTATYYNTWPNGMSNSWWVWDSPPLDLTTAYATFGSPQTLAQLNYNGLLPGGFARGLSAVIVSYVQVPTTDYWTFTLSAGSSARLYIGSDSFLLAPSSAGGAEVSATRALGAGLHQIRVDYHYGPTTPAKLILANASTTQVKTTIPASAYFRSLAAPPVCTPDVNNSGSVTVQDIFDFLASYFAGGPGADFNNSGSISVQDIFDFLAAYFAGCP